MPSTLSENIDLALEINIIFYNSNFIDISDDDIEVIKSGLLHAIRWFYLFLNNIIKNKKFNIIGLNILNDKGDGISIIFKNNSSSNSSINIDNLYICSVVKSIVVSCNKIYNNLIWPFDNNNISKVFVFYK